MKTKIANTYIQGTAIHFFTSEPFLAQDNITIVDPDEVLFGFQINGEDQFVWTYTFGVGDPDNVIQRVGLGLYVASIDTSNFETGVWVYSFYGRPSDAVDHDTTKTKVRAMGELMVLEPSFSMP